jgi:hypothetical protein
VDARPVAGPGTPPVTSHQLDAHSLADQLTPMFTKS